jgi:radical SAM-linked protein
MRFSSTRDFARALERALRRAGVPMAFSAGFHPHPKISYANGAPTGTASEAEYFEISVVEEVDPESVRAALDEALPEGLDIIRVVEASDPRRKGLAERLEASEWEVRFGRDTPADAVRAAVTTFLGAEIIEVTRTFKRGPRTFDVREPVVAMSVDEDASSSCAILRVVVRHTTPAVRPDDVLTALHSAAHFSPPSPPWVTRLAQGPLDAATARVADPLAADEDGVGT